MTQDRNSAGPESPLPDVDGGGLDAIARSAGGLVQDRQAAPVHLWNPPYCGDIGLAIKADGTWMYRGSAIARRPLVELFASVLRKDEDGKTYLVTPAEKVDVAVADAPFIGVELRIEGLGEDGNVGLRTNLDTWVTIDPAHPVRFVVQEPAGGLKPYVLIRGRLEALLSRAAYLDLVDHASVRDGELGFWSGGQWWPMRA